MTTPDALVRRYMERCNTASAAEIATCFVDDAVIYDLNHPPVRGASEIGAFWVKVRQRWRGATWTVVDLVVDGERVAMEWTMTGHCDGTDLEFRGADIVATSGGRITEIHQYWSYRPETGSTLVGYGS